MKAILIEEHVAGTVRVVLVDDAAFDATLADLTAANHQGVCTVSVGLVESAADAFENVRGVNDEEAVFRREEAGEPC